MSDLTGSITSRYETVLERMQLAAGRAGRSLDEIRLVAVTKTWPAEVVLAAAAVGLRHFGENRVEELAEKALAVGAALEQGDGISWHQIGTLQSRKTALAADAADVFHALDREKIAQRLSKRLQENGRGLPVFIEVNLSGERSKSGFVCERWEKSATQREDLRKVVEKVAGLPGLRLRGLMTMAALGASPAELHQTFGRTRELARWLETQVPGASLGRLSMGMTDDFEIAIEEGATDIRVGRALFGRRTGSEWPR